MIVSAYVMSAVGIPVYLHYCGGELEKVNYVIKSNSCCGGEEDDSSSTAKDCCKDENFIIQNSADFTLKQFHHYDLVKTYCDLFYVSLPFSVSCIQPVHHGPELTHKFPPQKLQQQETISVSVLRI